MKLQWWATLSSKLNLYYRFLLVILQMFSERYSVEQTQVIYFKWIIVWLCSYFKNNHQVQLRNQPLHSKVNVIILIIPNWCGSVDWVPACEPKGCWFDSQSGHMPGLRARFPSMGECKRQPHIDISVPLFLLPFPSV